MDLKLELKSGVKLVLTVCSDAPSITKVLVYDPRGFCQAVLLTRPRGLQLVEALILAAEGQMGNEKNAGNN